MKIRSLPSLFSPILEFCYPSRCTACNEPCPTALLCESCECAQSKLETHPACDRCAKPLTEWLAPCPYCKAKGMYPFDRIAALGVYDDPLKSLIQRLKYNRHWSLGESLAERLFSLDRVKDLAKNSDVVVPVPLHRWRHVKRGYNQSEVLARHLRKLSRPHLTFSSALQRTRSTQTQTDLHSHQARHDNVKGAFRLTRPSAITGKRILLIDDVMTTGATLQSAARALLEAKPTSVSAMVLAVADPRQRGFEAI